MALIEMRLIFRSACGGRAVGSSAGEMDTRPDCRFPSHLWRASTKAAKEFGMGRALHPRESEPPTPRRFKTKPSLKSRVPPPFLVEIARSFHSRPPTH